MDGFKPLDLFDEGIVQKIETIDSVKESIVEDSSENVQQDDILSTTDDATTDTDDSGDIISNNNEAAPQCIPDDSGAVLEKLGAIESFCQNFSTQLSDLEQLFSKRIMHADYEDKVIDQMHSELQKYKEDMYAQLVRPILLDIIEVRDSILRIAATYQSKPEGERDIPNKTFADYSYDLQDILEKNNVEIYRSKAGDDFSPIKQRVIKKEVTHDEGLHGKIAESLSSGYSYTGRIISAEKVSVYYYEKNEETINESEETENG